ncbi:MAG: YfhO family protein [Butyrivibrio sp.]|nr:YfhO family protein [Butyrivibrio sp.]
MSEKKSKYSKELESAKVGKMYTSAIMFASSFLMYILAVLPIFIKRGLPFFYYGDYNVQQVPFYILAHRAIRSGELFWNWNVDLGGTMAGDFSFYLWGSPFFWITVLFPEGAIPYLMPFLMALKYAFAATCAYLYIKRYVGRYVYAMIGGYLYAFSGFNACNIVFNHFTDSVAFFPLFLLLFEDLMAVDDQKDEAKLSFSGKPFIRFALITAYMSVVNYYFFFGQVVFFAIYFVVRYARKNKKNVTAVMLARAVLAGLLGVVISGFFLLQAFAGLKGNSRLENFITGYNMLVYPSEKLIWDIFKSLAMLPDIIGKGTLFYTGTVKNASLAAYIPLFGVSGVVAYFLMNKKKGNWEKTMALIFLVIALIPVFNSSFSFFNSAYYARWYYMPVLLMCLMTAQVIERGKTEQFKKGAVFAVLYFLLFVVIYFLPSTNDDGQLVLLNMTENNSIFVRDLLGTVVLSVALLIIAFVLPKRTVTVKEKGNRITKKKTHRDVIILGIVIAACILSTFVPIKNGSSIISERGKKKWQEQMLFNTVEVDQSQFCRGEVDSTSTNYDMVWGIPSVHCFLSTVPSEIFDFLKGAGDIKRTVETNIPVSRPGMRAILSARYYMENADISKNRVFYNDEGTEGYAFSYNQNGFDVFENLNFIPMGFTFDKYITESEWKDLEIKEHDYDLTRCLIISDKDAAKYGDSLDMEEITAEDIMEDEMSYLDLTKECTKRSLTSCSVFETDTYGFTAKTAPIQGNKLLFFSVPATEGFSCTVDGAETEILKADFGLMAIPVSEGVHDIRVTYTPEGFRSGLILSIIGVLVAAAYIVMLKKVKKND